MCKEQKEDKPSIVGLVDKFSDEIHPLVDWMNTDGKAVIMIAYDIESSPNSIGVAYGKVDILKQMLLDFLRRKDLRDLRHELARELALMFVDDISESYKLMGTSIEERARELLWRGMGNWDYLSEDGQIEDGQIEDGQIEDEPIEDEPIE